MKVIFAPEALDQFVDWMKQDRKRFERIQRILEECRRTPFSGTGKPEPLRNELRGWWSRRIDDEHRLVYRVVGSPPEQAIEILSCRGHYADR